MIPYKCGEICRIAALAVGHFLHKEVRLMKRISKWEVLQVVSLIISAIDLVITLIK